MSPKIYPLNIFGRIKDTILNINENTSMFYHILCDKKSDETKYILDWKIERSFKELIKSESNFTRRHEETLKVTFSISDASNNTIYTDSIVSKGAYNILEDEIIRLLIVCSYPPVVVNIPLLGRFVNPPPSPLKYPAEAVCGNKTFPVSNEAEIDKSVLIGI